MIKYIKDLFKRLFTIKKVRILYSEYKPNEIKIRIINPDATHLHESLGVTETRMNFLRLTLETNLKTDMDVPSILEKVSENTVHPNEIILVGIMVGTLYEQQKRNNIIAHLFKGPKDPE